MTQNLSHATLFPAVLIGGLIAFVIILIPLVFYVLTLQKALNRCAPQNRAMDPALAWLLLVPCFNIVWHFFVVLNLSKSLATEFQNRGIAGEPEPGKMLGLVMCILMCCGFVPLLGYVCGLAGFVCWIVYWIKIAGFSNRLA